MEQSRSTRSLDELREVLRSISAHEPRDKSHESDKKTKNVETSEHKKDISKEVPSPSLREALASIVQPEHSSQPAATPQQPKHPIAEKPEKAAVPEGAQEYAEKKNIDDPLSPKRLERMMRINTSDRSPLA